MTYEEALAVLKRGGKATRNGRTFVLRTRGIHDVTDEKAPERVYMSEDDRSATDWENPDVVVGNLDDAPEAVRPEVVDEVLTEESL